MYCMTAATDLNFNGNNKTYRLLLRYSQNVDSVDLDIALSVGKDPPPAVWRQARPTYYWRAISYWSASEHPVFIISLSFYLTSHIFSIFNLTLTILFRQILFQTLSLLQYVRHVIYINIIKLLKYV